MRPVHPLKRRLIDLELTEQLRAVDLSYAADQLRLLLVSQHLEHGSRELLLPRNIEDHVLIRDLLRPIALGRTNGAGHVLIGRWPL